MAGTMVRPGTGQIAPGEVTIGRDLGPVGRWVRVVSGVLSLSGSVGAALGASGPELVWTLVAVAAIGAYYLLLHWLLGERLFARANPWFGTTIVLGSLGAFTAPFMPAPVVQGAGLYVGATILLTAAIGYGGCEVAAPGTLLLGRRYVLYCPVNAVDAPERSLHHLRLGPAAWLAAVTAVVVGAYFLVGRGILTFFGLPDPIASWWALLLLGPAGLLATRALQAARQPEVTDRAEVRVLGLGAVVLVALAMIFTIQIPHDIVWAAVMLGGLAVATGRAVAALLRRHRTASDLE